MGESSLGSSRGIWDLGLEHSSQNPALQNSPSSIPRKFVSPHKMHLAAHFVVRGGITKVICFHFAAVEGLNKSCVVQNLPP